MKVIIWLLAMAVLSGALSGYVLYAAATLELDSPLRPTHQEPIIYERWEAYALFAPWYVSTAVISLSHWIVVVMEHSRRKAA